MKQWLADLVALPSGDYFIPPVKEENYMILIIELYDSLSFHVYDVSSDLCALL